MPQGYSQEDFAKMQQQAINRVREMQRQSQKKEQQDTAKPVFETKDRFEKAQRPQTENINSDPPERIFEPEKKDVPPSPPPIKRVRSVGKTAASFLETDSDVALILPLLLLLQRDGADEMLILALLYIMA